MEPMEPKQDQVNPPENSSEGAEDAPNEVKARRELEEARTEAATARTAYLEDVSPGLAARVADWKRKYGRVESTHILDQIYVYRGMNRGEYQAMVIRGLDKEKNEQDIAARCVLFPDLSTMDWVLMPAGLPYTLSELTLAASGFVTQDPSPIRL
jgi:hypothetical protein